ncbi:MAG TPA: hypothetical protein VME69_11895 [Methylocella sp.]|nr:hypothetical protein [Methylocella sp.]
MSRKTMKIGVAGAAAYALAGAVVLMIAEPTPLQAAPTAFGTAGVRVAVSSQIDVVYRGGATRGRGYGRGAYGRGVYGRGGYGRGGYYGGGFYGQGYGRGYYGYPAWGYTYPYYGYPYPYPYPYSGWGW